MCDELNELEAAFRQKMFELHGQDWRAKLAVLKEVRKVK